MNNIPTAYEPLHVVRFAGGVTEFIKSKDSAALMQKLNTDRVIAFGDKFYAARLFETCEPFTSKDGLEVLIATCPKEYRARLVAEVSKYREATGKTMSLHTAQCHLAAWAKETA